MTTKTLAIRTGRFFTAVRVDTVANECRVALASLDGGALFVTGTSETSIKQAAFDGSGRGYRTLKALMAENEGAERRKDFDA